MRDALAPMPAALIFDLDGTLLQTEAAHSLAVRQSLSELGCAYGEDEYRAQLGVPVAEILAQAIGQQPELLARATARTRQLFLQGRHGVQLVHGLSRFLRGTAWLARAVATSTDRATARALLRAAGLGAKFDVVVTADDVAPGATKPRPDLYALAARRLGVDAKRCWAFEDSARGVLAARNAGMAVVGLMTSVGAATLSGATEVVSDFSDARLRRWFARGKGHS